MKLQTLQLHLRNFIEPWTQLGVPQTVLDDLRNDCDRLARFGDATLADFVVLLEQAEEFRKTKELAIPSFVRPVVSCYEKLRALKDRAAHPDANRDEVDKELQAVDLDNRNKEELVNIAREIGCDVTTKTTKPQAINAIWQNITGHGTPSKKSARSPKKPAKEPAQPKPTFDVLGTAQKILTMKERANLPESTREEMDQQLEELKLDSLSKADLIALAGELSCEVNSKTTKPKALEAIKRVVLVIKEMAMGTAQ